MDWQSWPWIGMFSPFGKLQIFLFNPDLAMQPVFRNVLFRTASYHFGIAIGRLLGDLTVRLLHRGFRCFERH